MTRLRAGAAILNNDHRTRLLSTYIGFEQDFCGRFNQPVHSAFTRNGFAYKWVYSTAQRLPFLGCTLLAALIYCLQHSGKNKIEYEKIGGLESLLNTNMAEASTCTSTVASLTDRERVSKLYNRHISMSQTTSTPCCSEASTLSGCLWTLHVSMRWDSYLHKCYK